MRENTKSAIWLLVYMSAWFIVLSGAIADVDISYRAVIVVMAICFVYVFLMERRKTIRLKYFTDGIGTIEKISVGDWIDLRAAETVTLCKGDYYLIRLGVGMILPDGYEAHVLPRSSTPNKFGIILANSMGVIDNSYSGNEDEWRFPAYAIRDTVIRKGDRIAQFRIVENQPTIRLKIVDRLREVSRGGIGSTGTR